MIIIILCAPPPTFFYYWMQEARPSPLNLLRQRRSLDLDTLTDVVRESYDILTCIPGPSVSVHSSISSWQPRRLLRLVDCGAPGLLITTGVPHDLRKLVK